MTFACVDNRTSGTGRRAARLVALVFFWMCSIGVIAHNDDPIAHASHSSVVSLGHVAVTPPAGECAACEWTSGVQVGSSIQLSAPLPIFHVLAAVRPLADGLISTPVRFTPLRGPPSDYIA
jgi:hypothetical protein